jgi:hypothetical protein
MEGLEILLEILGSVNFFEKVWIFCGFLEDGMFRLTRDLSWGL